MQVELTKATEAQHRTDEDWETQLLVERAQMESEHEEEMAQARAQQAAQIQALKVSKIITIDSYEIIYKWMHSDSL